MTVEPADSMRSPESDAREGFPRERRFIFVQLLFSLTAAQIAKEIAELILRGYGFREALPAYTHLVLASAVVVTSWVGWSASIAGRRLKVDHVFSWPFLILLTDVALVVLYFLLVVGAELPPQGTLEEPHPSVTPSTWNEAVFVAWIFCGYFIWDVLTKAVIPEEESMPNGSLGKFFGRFFSNRLWNRGWISLVCMLLGGVAGFCLSEVRDERGVVIVDASLFSLVFLFRAWKENRWKVSILFLILALGFGVWAAIRSC